MFNLGLDYSDFAAMRFYKKADDTREIVLTTLNEKCNSTKEIKNEFLCLFNDILFSEPCCYWDKKVYSETYKGLIDLNSNASIIVDESTFLYFLTGYSAYRQITEIINDLETINDSPEIKNRLYRLPTYINLIEGCLSNLFRFILHIIDMTTSTKCAIQNNLQPICDILNKHGFPEMLKYVNVNIRNAINHGGVIFKNGGQEIHFFYKKNRQPCIDILQMFDLDNLIQRLYDTASAVVLAVTHYLNNTDAIRIDTKDNSFEAYEYLSMKLSIPTLKCNYIQAIPKNKQLNLDFYIEKADNAILFETAVEMALIIYPLHSNFDQYYFSFSNERLASSFIRFTNQEIKSIITREREISDIILNVVHRQDCMIFQQSTEDVDLNEIKYFRFPNFSCSEYKISRVEEASNENRKRYRAHLYIGEISEKSDILRIIESTVEWLKNLRNVPSPTIPHKSGTMEADSLYINVYKQDTRKNKNLMLNNENFVCFVDYNIDGETTLKNGGLPKSLWDSYAHEQLGNIHIAWRDRKYASKISRNALCPCGSGKKYKRCCGQ
jgi:hypothetical protein